MSEQIDPACRAHSKFLDRDNVLRDSVNLNRCVCFRAKANAISHAEREVISTGVAYRTARHARHDMGIHEELFFAAVDRLLALTNAPTPEPPR